jgi:putative addiction module killer protein
MRVEVYTSPSGRQPLQEWLAALLDARGRQRVLARIQAAADGNLGNWRSLGSGLFEMRVFHGPGYRIYFAREGESLVILLSGGSKGSQQRDIESARRYLADYRERTHGAH